MFCAISVSAEAALAAGDKIVELAAKSIKTLDSGLDLYTKYLDKLIRWDDFDKTIEKMNKFRSEYSKEAATLIGEIQTKFMNAKDAYFRATRHIFDWCGLALILLKPYRAFFEGEMDQETYNSTRDIILELLQAGVNYMDKGTEELTACSSSFNEAAGKLTELNLRLVADFNETSDYYETQKVRIRYGYAYAVPFSILGISIAALVIEGNLIPALDKQMRNIEHYFQDLEKEVQSSKTKIVDTKDILEKEVSQIGKLETEVKAPLFFIKMTNVEKIKKFLLESVDNLIMNCKAYQTRHGGINTALKGI